MPENPTNKADETLQRYARERRARGGDFSLHPASRRLLQGEVLRQFGGAARGESRGGIASWFGAWRTVGICCGLVAVLGFGAWLVSRHSSELGTMQDELAKAELPSRQLAPRNDERESGKAAALDEVSRSIAPDASAMKSAVTTPAPAIAPITSPSTSLPEVKLLAEKDFDQPKSKAAPSRARSNLAPTAPTGPPSDTVLVRKMEFETIESDTLDAAKKSDSVVANYSISGALENSATGNDLLKRQQSPAAAAESLALNNAAPQSDSRGDVMNRNQSRPIARGGAQQLTDNHAFENNRQGFVGGRAGNAGGSATQNINRDGATAVANNSYFNQQTPAPTSGAAQNQVENSQRQNTQRQYALNENTPGRRSQLPAELDAAGKEKQSSDAAVLTRFSIEQIGNLMRLTDADGSLYEGAFVSDETTAPEDRTVTAKGAAVITMRMKREVPAPRRLAFRVTGTNRTFNQMVVVNGTFSSSAPAGPAGSFAEPPADKKLQDRGAVAQFMPATPAIPTTKSAGSTRALQSDVAPAIASTNIVNSVEGTVRVGGSAERPFRALRVIQ